MIIDFEGGCIGQGIGMETPEEDADVRHIVASSPGGDVGTEGDVAHVYGTSRPLKRASQPFEGLGSLLAYIDQDVLCVGPLNMLCCREQFNVFNDMHLSLIHI